MGPREIGRAGLEDWHNVATSEGKPAAARSCKGPGSCSLEDTHDLAGA